MSSLGVESTELETDEQRGEPATALVLGATGLVGSILTRQLLALEEYGVIRTLVRRPLHIENEKLETKVVDFERIEGEKALFGCEQVFCCWGTSLKQAGNESEFRRIEHDLPLMLARHARECGASGLFVVSTLGADPRSGLLYYRVKGELENDLKALGFPTLAIFRPSLLVGERTEARFGERLLQGVTRPFGPLFLGPLRKFRPIAAHTVASAMSTVARAACRSRLPLGVAIYESDAIAEFARAR